MTGFFITNLSDLEQQLQILITPAQLGDKVAYSEFLNLLYPHIRTILRRRLNGLVDFEDLTQECLIGIHKNLASYHPSRPLKPWISAIIRYKVADYFRALAKKIEVTDILFDPNSTYENSKNEDQAHEVREWLGRLPSSLRRAVELTQLEGVSYSEAAIREGISEVALRKRVSRAYIELRQIVAKAMEVDFGSK